MQCDRASDQIRARNYLREPVVSDFRRAARRLLLFAVMVVASSASAKQLTIAGFAFAGDFADIPARYPYSFQALKDTSHGELRGLPAVSRLTVERARKTSNQTIKLNFDELATLRGASEALVGALIVTGETVLVEDFGTYHKIFINLRADALIFDFKAQTVMRSYPISVIAFDAMSTRPSEDQLVARVRTMVLGASDDTLISRFAMVLSRVVLPEAGARTVQIRKVDVAPSALEQYPSSMRSPTTVAASLADRFSSELTSQAGVALVPARASHATGVMQIRFDDSQSFDLRIPEGDYVFDLRLQRLVKMQHASNNVGASYIFGAFIDIEFSEPLLAARLLKSEFKNGEVAVVPAGRKSSDDFPGYQDAINGLFRKFSASLAKPDMKWLKSASAAADIEAQLNKVRNVMERAKW